MISFKTTQGLVGIGNATLQEGNAFQRMGDIATTASNYLVVSGALTGDRVLQLQYPDNAASQSAWYGVTFTVVNGSNANNIQVNTQDGGGAAAVGPGLTGMFVFDGTSLQCADVYIL